MERESGFYWVKWQGEWEVAQWYDASVWLVPGTESGYNDEMFDEINETKLQPPA